MSWRHPHVHDMCFRIAVASGHLNRFTDETDIRNRIAGYIDKQDDNLLFEFDTWLTTCTEDELETIADGDEADARRLMESAPTGFEKWFSDYFEEPMF